MTKRRHAFRSLLHSCLVRGCLSVVVVVVFLLAGWRMTAKFAVPPMDCAHAAQAPNPVEAENTCPGTDGWQVDHPIGPDNAIEGFTSPASVDVGGMVRLYVSTTAARYTFSVYRMGWYGGSGGRLVFTSPTITGTNQPPPLFDHVTHMVSCDNWTHPSVIRIPVTWVSGFYVVKLISSDGYMRYAPFIVRDDSSRAPILYTSSFMTYQAYNAWGGYSLYRGPDPLGNAAGEQRALVVSFDRPYDQHNGLMDFVSYEAGLLRWLERQSYNMTYAADVDLDTMSFLPQRHRLLLVAGHDEYWSTTMRTTVTNARNAGVSLAFFGANDVYWHVRLQASPLGPDREVVCYKHGYYQDGTRDTTDPLAATEPNAATVRWRDAPLNQPEDSLLGQMYHGGVVDVAPLVLSVGARPYLGSTQLKPNSSIPGIVGWEYDQYSDDGTAPRNVTILASSPVRCQPTDLCPASGNDRSNATIYTAPSGAKVFDAGTFLWGRGLDPGFDPADAAYTSPGLQRMTANLLASLLTAAAR